MQTRAVEGSNELTAVSIRRGPAKIILVIRIDMVNREAIDRLVREFYHYFASLLTMVQDGTEQEIAHYGLIFHVSSAGRSFDVGIDFRDDETLTINFFRLAEFLKDPKGKKTRLGVVELEYPKRAKIPLFASILSFIYLVAYSGIATWLRVTGGAIVAISWVVVMFMRHRNCGQPDAYRREFADKAKRWIDST